MTGSNLLKCWSEFFMLLPWELHSIVIILLRILAKIQEAIISIHSWKIKAEGSPSPGDLVKNKGTGCRFRAILVKSVVSLSSTLPTPSTLSSGYNSLLGLARWLPGKKGLAPKPDNSNLIPWSHRAVGRKEPTCTNYPPTSTFEL